MAAGADVVVASGLVVVVAVEAAGSDVFDVVEGAGARVVLVAVADAVIEPGRAVVAVVMLSPTSRAASPSPEPHAASVSGIVNTTARQRATRASVRG